MRRRKLSDKDALSRARRASRRQPVVPLGEDPPDYVFHILDVIRSIPRGRVCTYGRVAEAAGIAGRARLVGRVLRDSPFAASVQWHRVIGASGRISDRPGDGALEQRHLLLNEGVEVSLSGMVKLIDHLWAPKARKIKPRSSRTTQPRRR
jgi:methylated-DNA-protein-cysteine methyltransferase-like protein